MSEPYTPSITWLHDAYIERAELSHGDELTVERERELSDEFFRGIAAHDESVRAEARAEAERRVSSAVNATLTAARIAREVRETFTAPAELTSGPVNADDVASAVADFIEGMGK